MSSPWQTADPLGEALHLLRMAGVFYCRSEFTEPWGLELPPFANCMMFHVVTSGQCWLDVTTWNIMQFANGGSSRPHGSVNSDRQ